MRVAGYRPDGLGAVDDVGFSAEGARAAEFFGLVDRRSVDEDEDEWEY